MHLFLGKPTLSPPETRVGFFIALVVDCSLGGRRPVEILEELRALQRDLTELGDALAVALLERAERCFLSSRL